MDDAQNFNIDLTDIVPEYYRSKQIRKIFLTRLEIALSYLRKIKAKTVLDAGCGDGLFTNKVRELENVEQITGIDYNVHTEELNAKYIGINFLRADLFKQLPFRMKFDAITCLDVLEHFEDVEVILKNLSEVLKDRGYLVVSGPVESFLYKCGRFVTKGTFSQESGPGAGKHYHNIIELNKIIIKHFDLVERKKVKFLFIHLFDVNLYCLKADTL
jgi:2-polyprenyl-3-methyl-5-hydroxy-6-metoxy-1,4-benzoquinol methylase